MNIENRRVLITGANRGIGKALVDEALRRGSKKLYAGMRSLVQHDKRVTPLTLDVTQRKQWPAPGIPPERVETVLEVLAERRKCLESSVYLDTHKLFDVHPTTFTEFARRNAAVLRGEPVATVQ